MLQRSSPTRRRPELEHDLPTDAVDILHSDAGLGLKTKNETEFCLMFSCFSWMS